MSNRARGAVAAARGRTRDGAVDDAILVERVRATLGRALSHPRPIGVFASNGTVTLRGPIIAREVKRLLAAVVGVRGVLTVINELEPHEHADRVPALQGEGRFGRSAFDRLPSNWLPATRTLVSATAVAAAGAAFAYARR